MKTIQVTLQERWAASKHRVHKSKKKYDRKDKHKNKGPQKGPFSVSASYPALPKVKLSVKVKL